MHIFYHQLLYIRFNIRKIVMDIFFSHYIIRILHKKEGYVLHELLRGVLSISEIHVLAELKININQKEINYKVWWTALVFTSLNSSSCKWHKSLLILNSCFSWLWTTWWWYFEIFWEVNLGRFPLKLTLLIIAIGRRQTNDQCLEKEMKNFDCSPYKN